MEKVRLSVEMDGERERERERVWVLGNGGPMEDPCLSLSNRRRTRITIPCIALSMVKV